MKNRKTKFVKLGILLFGISLLLFNCEKDNEINESFNNKLDYTLEKIGYSKLITDQEIQNTLPLIKGRFSNNKKRKNQSKKTTQISEHFSIITDSIHKITTEDAITWTFKIETPVLQNSDFENFLVKKHNEEFSYFLVSYEKDLETGYKKATSYPISKEFLNLDNLNLARRGDYLMDDGISNGGTGCEGIITHHPCSNGDSYIHGPEPYVSGGYCSGTITIIDFSHCFITGTSNNANSNTNNTSNNNNTLYNSGGGSSSSGGTTITNPVTLECDNCSNSQSLISYLNLTEQTQIDWVNDSTNLLKVNALFNFGDTKQWSDDTKIFVKSAIEVLSLKELSPTSNIDTFKNRILRITSNLKKWGNPEDEIFAEYIEDLVQDFHLMTVGDVYDIYKLTDKQSKILIWKYAAAVIVPIAETAYPFIVYAVTEASLGAALPLLSRIPLAAVIRGAKLNKMATQLAKLGAPGSSSRIRLIPNGNYDKTLALFNKITKNSVSPVTTTATSNGRIIKVANMGNGNYITFRNFDNSGTANLVANIDLKFPSIWTKTRELKFIK